jgi:hypothetical protein
MSLENLADYFKFFVQGLPVGAFMGAIVWAVAFAIELMVKWLKS